MLEVQLGILGCRAVLVENQINPTAPPIPEPSKDGDSEKIDRTSQYCFIKRVILLKEG